VPRTASTDDANARGRCATRCYIRRLIDRRAQARRMAAFAVSGYSISTHSANRCNCVTAVGTDAHAIDWRKSALL